MNALTAISEFAEDLTEIRRDIHAHPELGFQEERTSGIVAQHLEELGVEVHRGIGGTGVVGVLDGTGPGRTIGLRADMDALPIDEAAKVTWISKHSGVMHACGHDGHTAILLGAARYLARARDFVGKIILIFQPAEEGLGGARAMLADGLFDRFPCDEIYGLHNKPGEETGAVSVLLGPAMAGADFFDMEISGRGSHAAYPQQGTDVLLATAALVQALNTITARDISANDSAVLSVTRMEGGKAYNVLPDSANIGGTMRFLSDKSADTVRKRMDDIAAGIARSYDVEVKVSREQVFNVLENDPACGKVVMDVAADVVGRDKVVERDTAHMGSEDFADMLRTVPGAYFGLGHNSPAPLHNPGFVLDDAILPIGAAIFCEIAKRRTAANAS